MGRKKDMVEGGGINEGSTGNKGEVYLSNRVAHLHKIFLVSSRARRINVDP